MLNLQYLKNIIEHNFLNMRESYVILSRTLSRNAMIFYRLAYTYINNNG